ncbi:MAG: hypothetical protein JKY46_00820 [Robiginitomaculum sp.]|nr:hypothetical protein [Robiginitomaculum sp.]
MSFLLAASLIIAPAPVEQLTNACIAEGEPRSECVCYAKFIEKNSSKREIKALATLVAPENRESLEQAFAALLKAGLTPTEIFDIGMRVDSLTDKASKACEGK